MNTSGDAAEQVVRLSLEGVEVAAKITGSAAKEVAALLYAAIKNRDKNKIKGKQSLTSMLKSGKELSIFSVKNEDMKRFVADAKRYGVVYCALRNTKDNPSGECEIMVRAEDAAKINRIVENIKIATVMVSAQTIRRSYPWRFPKSVKWAVSLIGVGTASALVLSGVPVSFLGALMSVGILKRELSRSLQAVSTVCNGSKTVDNGLTAPPSLYPV